jgi:hypothetical protein
MQTFVVRIWSAADGKAETDLPPIRGLVEHVASGAKSAFRGAPELVAFLEANAAPPSREVRPTDPS